MFEWVLNMALGVHIGVIKFGNGAVLVISNYELSMDVVYYGKGCSLFITYKSST